jgi:hypothetical protein
MIRRGDISDGETIAALALAGIHLGRFPLSGPGFTDG